MQHKPDTSLLGARIRACREQANLTAQHVAESLGRDRQSVYRWEWGRTNPSLDELTRLAELFGVDVSYLTFGIATPR